MTARLALVLRVALVVAGSFATVLLAGARPASAEERPAPVPPGRHAVQHEVFLDLGLYAGLVPWRYVVREGDTLGEIAERELSAARRQAEIRELNPGLVPSRMPAGTVLVMPPRAPSTSDRASWYVFFAHAAGPEGWSSPRRLDGTDLHRLGHGTQVSAVPYARLRQVLAGSSDGRIDARALLGAEGVAHSAPVEGHESLPDDDPARRIVTVLRVGAIRGNRLLLEAAREERYDEAGRLVPAPSGAGPGTGLLLLAFTAMFLAFAWAIARRSVVAPGDPSGASGPATPAPASGASAG